MSDRGGGQRTSGFLCLQGRHILLVEDNVISQHLGRALLAAPGMDVTVATDGAAALKALDEVSVDLVLMDIQMPGMNGFEATKILRQNPRLCGLPVVAMTADASEDTRHACLAAGMDELVTKPIVPERLYALIQRHLQMSNPCSTTGGHRRSSTTTLGDLPGINVGSGLCSTDGDVQLYTKLLLKFRRLHAADCDELQALVAQRRTDEARQLVHSLKGVAGTIGITDIVDQCLAMEGAFPDRVTVGMTEALVRAHNRALASIARLPDETLESARESNVEDTPWPKLVTEMRTLLKQGNFRALNFLSSHRKNFCEHDSTLLEELEERLMQFRFDDAIESLERIDAVVRLEK